MKKILFLCTHNSARSQMAEAYLNHLYGDRYKAYSAGTHPTKINSKVVKVLAEDGLDLGDASSKSIDEFLDFSFDIVVTECNNAREACPISPGGDLVHKSFKDPSSCARDVNQVFE